MSGVVTLKERYGPALRVRVLKEGKTFLGRRMLIVQPGAGPCMLFIHRMGRSGSSRPGLQYVDEGTFIALEARFNRMTKELPGE